LLYILSSLSLGFVCFIFLEVVNRRWNKDLSFCFAHFIFLAMVNRRWNKDLSFCFVHFIFLAVVNRRWNKDLSFCFAHFIFLAVVNRRWNKDLSFCGFWFKYSYCDLYCEWSLEQVRWSRKKSKMVMATLYVVIVMFVSHINVCMYRLMFAKKEGFGKGVMWCNIDGQECEVGCMKNVICRVYKYCLIVYYFSFQSKGFL
jgi:hypothetical protein